jgi:hypothetical protein
MTDAREVLARMPVAHTHNLTIADAEGDVITAYLNPDRPVSFRRLPIAVNHQWSVESWDPVLAESTLQREWWLLRLLDDPDVDHERFLGAFLVPPLYSLAHDVGRGTVWTGVYDPQERDITYAWPPPVSRCASTHSRRPPSSDVPAVAALGLNPAYRGPAPTGVLSKTSGVFRTTRRPEPSRLMTTMSGFVEAKVVRDGDLGPIG